jgi:4-hydroxy-2-oxoheptanedioate aldolase
MKGYSKRLSLIQKRKRATMSTSPSATTAEFPLPKNQFKKALKAGKNQIGLWCSMANHYAVEVVAGAGFDWLLLDTEHAPNDLESVLLQLQAASRYNLEPVVRVAWNDMVAIKRYLDIGVLTILIPQVQNAEEARAAVSYTRYAPEGVRGVSGTNRATKFGRVKDYAKQAHKEICVLVQVESGTALDEIEAIAMVPGVDGIFIGPADLHASLGFPGETRRPEVMDMIIKATKRIRKAGKAPGFLTAVEEDANRVLAAGSQFVAVGSDIGILARGADNLRVKYK